MYLYEQPRSWAKIVCCPNHSYCLTQEGQSQVGREGKRLWRGERWLVRPRRTGETPLGEAGTEHRFGQRLQEIFLFENVLQIIRQWCFKLHRLPRDRVRKLQLGGVQELPFERDAFEDAA